MPGNTINQPPSLVEIDDWQGPLTKFAQYLADTNIAGPTKRARYVANLVDTEGRTPEFADYARGERRRVQCLLDQKYGSAIVGTIEELTHGN